MFLRKRDKNISYKVKQKCLLLQSVRDDFDGRVLHAGGHVGRKGNQVEPEAKGEVKERISQGTKSAEMLTFSNLL